MDVKLGNGAFMRTHDDAAALGRAIAGVANTAGLPTRALLTDMNECLGTTAGNALEVGEAVAFLDGRAREPRLAEVVLTLGVELLALSGLEPDAAAGRARLEAAIADGSAAERFARMVAALGGPRDAMAPRALAHAEAPVVVAVPAPADGFVSAVATRQLGLAVIELGGGRTTGGSGGRSCGRAQRHRRHRPAGRGRRAARAGSWSRS